jgi:hypothetical protein
VSALVEIAAVDEGRQSESDARTKLLLITQADLAGIADLGADRSVAIQSVLASDAEVGGVARSGPAEGDAGLQLRGDLLEYAAAENLSVVDGRMDGEIAGGVSDAEVVLRQLGFGGIEGHLVAGQPSVVADDGRGVDDGSAQVQIDVGVGGELIVFEFGLQFAALGSGLRGERRVERQLETLDELILDVDRRRQLVVGVPFLRKGDALLLELVLRFQRAVDFSAVEVRLTSGREFDAARRFRFDFEFEDAEVIALVHDIPSGFSQITVRRRSHFCELVLEWKDR